MEINNMELTNKQMEAVFCNGHTLCYAPAGSGKTKVMIERIKRISKENPDRSILVMAFNNTLPDEFKSRLGDSLTDNIHISTFHSFCLKGVRQHHPKKKVLSQGKQISFLRDNWNLFDTGYFDYDKAIKVINEFSKISNLEESVPKEFEAIHKKYLEYKVKNNYIDYDDMLRLYYELIKFGVANPSYDYVFIDEFQDFNRYQYLILEHLIKNSKETFCVGDIKQAIYSFRGGNIKYVKLFEINYANNVVTLDKTFRCSKDIIYVANIVAKKIDNNEAVAIHSNGTVTFNEYKSMFYLVEQAIRVSQSNKTAILLATNREVSEVANQLLAKGVKFDSNENNKIPFNIHIMLGFACASKGIKNKHTSFYYRMVANYRKGMYKRNKLLSKLILNGKTLQEYSVTELYELISDISEVEKGFLIATLFDMGNVTPDFLIKYFTDKHDSSIYIGTIHSAKGLEWDNVFTVLCDTMPGENKDSSEYLTMLYTVLTRARNNLYIFYCPENKFYKMLKGD